MQDNFDLKGYLRNGNKLLNEGIGGYMDLKPVNELDNEGEPEGDQYDGEYDGHTGPAIANEAFDFEDFQDTDLAGPGVEMTIDEIIADYDRIIKTNVPKEMQDSARIAVKKLWMQKIKDWRF